MLIKQPHLAVRSQLKNWQKLAMINKYQMGIALEIKQEVSHLVYEYEG